MALFWHRKRTIGREKLADEKSSKEVNRMTKEVHQTAYKTNQDIKRLNDLLKSNGITFKIHIATGGKH